MFSEKNTVFSFSPESTLAYETTVEYMNAFYSQTGYDYYFKYFSAHGRGPDELINPEDIKEIKEDTRRPKVIFYVT